MTTPYYEDATVTVLAGDCLDVLRDLPDCSVDAVVTDPPYGLEFMGKAWDGADGFRRSLNAADVGRDNAFGRASRTSPEYRTASKAQASRRQEGGISQATGPSFLGGLNPRCLSCNRWQRGRNPCTCGAPEWTQERLVRLHSFQEWCEAWATECLRVLKPGGHMLAFGGTRTSHRLACAIEDAGFEIRDSIAWLYGSGFSKGGLLGNRAGVSWCVCGENPVPYSHANNADVPRVRDDLHSPPVARGEGENGVLLAPVQRGGKGPGVGEARPQRAGGVVTRGGGTNSRIDARRKEPRMEGWDVSRTREGLSDGADAGAPASPGEWLRGGTLVGDGVPDRASCDASRGSASHQPGPSGQPTGELEVVPGSHEPLDDGARRGRVGCPRCGGTPNEFRGFSTTLKPAHEPIVVARKPLTGTVAHNVTTWGTGALNVDGCRVEGEADLVRPAISRADNVVLGKGLGVGVQENPSGRWPANVVLDQDAAAELDAQSGDQRDGVSTNRNREPSELSSASGWGFRKPTDDVTYGSGGGASRYFYTAKADASERVRLNGTAHPTVKPLALMRWLVRLVTPPGGVVLDMFAGSGTTVEAAILEGFRCIAIEREPDYLPLIVQRINRRRDPVAAVKASTEDPGLFDLLDGEGA